MAASLRTGMVVSDGWCGGRNERAARRRQVVVSRERYMLAGSILPFSLGFAANMQLQIATTTSLNRYPELFSFVAERLKHKGRILSFGCSEGAEVFTLAQHHFDNSEIVGIDVNPGALAIANRLLGDKDYMWRHPIRSNRVRFQLNDGSNLGRFDCVFAMSVLCRWPAPTDVLTEFPHKTFVSAIRQIDAMVKPGGYLVLYNTAYRFEETTVARGYKPVPIDDIGKAPFVTMFHRDGAIDDGPVPAVVFRRHTIAYRVRQRLARMFRHKTT